MFGFSLSHYIPYIVYGLSFVIAFLSLFFRTEFGLLFISFFLPIYAVINKVILLEYPFSKDVVDIILIAMLLGLMLQAKDDPEKRIAYSPQLFLIVLFMGYSFFSFIWGSFYSGDDIFSESTFKRLMNWKNYMIMPLLYLTCYYSLKNRKWQYALFLLLAVSMLVAEYKFKLTFRWYKHTHYSDEMRLSGTFAFLGSNEWGSFHAIYTLFLIGLFLVDKHIWRRTAYIILIIGGGYATMYSYSRGAYVGFIIGLLIIALVRSKKLLIPLIVFLLFWKSILPLSVVERIEGTFTEEAPSERYITLGETHIDTSGRAILWRKALDIFYENPIIGAGYNTYQRTTAWDTHSIYFKTLAEQGLIGITILLWLFFRAFRSGWHLYKESEEDFMRALGFGFFCAAVGNALVNIFGDRWTYFQLGGVFWVLWALVDQENSRIKLAKEIGSIQQKVIVIKEDKQQTTASPAK